MCQLVEVPAKLSFDPPNLTKKHLTQSQWKIVSIALIDTDINKYYAWFIKKRFNLSLVEPLRGGHVTFISDRISELQEYNKVKNRWNGQQIDLKLNLNIRTNGKYWWLKAECPVFNQIRDDLKLGEPFFSYHMTIGYPKELDLDFSYYLYNYLITYY